MMKIDGTFRAAISYKHLQPPLPNSSPVSSYSLTSYFYRLSLHTGRFFAISVNGMRGVNVQIRSSMPIKHILVPEVCINWKGPSAHIERSRNRHGDVEVACVSRKSARGGRNGRATRDGGDEHATADFGVAAEAAESEGKDGGKAGALEAEDKDEEGDARVSFGQGCCEAKNEAEAQVDGEYVSRLECLECHEVRSEETVEGVQPLSDG